MDISPTLQKQLIESARSIRGRAFAPYSNFLVGAAILTTKGTIYTGVNIENASYGLTVCAERNAVGAMVGGGEQSIAAVAVATINGVTPCGACRQVLREFGQAFPIWIIDETAGSIRQTTLSALLPDSFDSSQLPEVEGNSG